MQGINYKYDILSNFLSKGISLDNMGVNETCWAYDDILDIINYLYKKEYAVLGGDVLIKNNGSIQYTYDNWYVDKKEDESLAGYLKRCRDESINYINKYVKLNNNEDKDIYFVIVYKYYDI